MKVGVSHFGFCEERKGKYFAYHLKDVDGCPEVSNMKDRKLQIDVTIMTNAFS